MRKIVTKEGAIYEGQESQFQDQPDHVVYASGGGRYRIYKVNITVDKQWEDPAPASSGCYVATYAYGSADAPEVRALRRFRDEGLARSAAGRLFIRAYYAWLSGLAIRVMRPLGAPARAGTRRVLDRIARWSERR